MWTVDHTSDNSFHLWVPYDWYNILCVAFNHVYMATMRYWWIGTMVGAYIVCSIESPIAPPTEPPIIPLIAGGAGGGAARKK